VSDEILHIRSFRVVFDLERRIHRIDRFRVPLPYGLPLRSLGYAVAALVAILVASRLPVLGAVLKLLPTPARLVLAPVGLSYALTQLRLDGRSAHAAAGAWARYTLAPKLLVAFRRAPGHGQVAFSPVTLVRPAMLDRSADGERSAGEGPAKAGRSRQLRLDGVEQLELL
jgi:hypothetical protein